MHDTRENWTIYEAVVNAVPPELIDEHELARQEARKVPRIRLISDINGMNPEYAEYLASDLRVKKSRYAVANHLVTRLKNDLCKSPCHAIEEWPDRNRPLWNAGRRPRRFPPYSLGAILVSPLEKVYGIRSGNQNDDLRRSHFEKITAKLGAPRSKTFKEDLEAIKIRPQRSI
jgi:hypothetical protein